MSCVTQARRNMTTTLDVMKRAITRALELEEGANVDILRWFYRGKVIGALEMSVEILNKSEFAELWAHYKSEDERFN